MQLEWGTLLEQARAHHAQARANQTTAEATLLAMHRSHGEWHGQDYELDAWFSDAQGVAEVAKSLVRSQSGSEPERHQGRVWATPSTCKLGVHTSTSRDQQGLA